MLTEEIIFLLSTLKVAYFLSIWRSEDNEEESIAQTRTKQTWNEDDKICVGNILSTMSDALFHIYQNVQTTKEQPQALEEKYKSEDTTSKKFVLTF